MAKNRHKPEEKVPELREVDVHVPQGMANLVVIN
jgi:hypothetical protein